MPHAKPLIGLPLIGLLVIASMPASASEWAVPAYIDARFPHREARATFQFDASGRLLFPAATQGSLVNFVHVIVPGARDSPWTWSTLRDRWLELNKLVPCPAGGFVVGGSRTVHPGSLWRGDANTGWIARVDALGKTLWYSEIGGWPAGGLMLNPVYGLAVDAQCNVLVHANYDSGGSDVLVALRAFDGSIAWTVPRVEGYWSQVEAVGDAWVATADEPDGLRAIAFDPATGARRWQQLWTHPAGFASTYPSDWQVYALSTSTWALAASWRVDSGAVLEVRAVSPHDGTTLARRQYVQANVNHSFDRGGDGVIVALGREVESLSPLLQSRWSRTMPDLVEAIAGLPDGGALVCTDDGADAEFVTRLGGSNGVPVWPAPLQLSCRRIAASPDGAVAAVSYTTSSMIDPPTMIDVGTSDRVAEQFQTQVPLGTFASGFPVVLDANTVIDTSVTAFRSGSALLVRAIARDSGLMRWAQRLEFGSDGMQRDFGSGLAVALTDGTILVSGYTALQVPTNIPADGLPSTRAVVARLRALDGAVLERTGNDESNAVTSFSVSTSGAVFATRYRVYRESISIREVQSVDRLDGITTVWRQNDAPRALTIGPSMRVAATSSLVVAFDPRSSSTYLQGFDAEDGSLGWVNTRTFAGTPSALVSDGADRVFLVYPTRANRPDLDVTVERIDLLDGSAAWRHTFDVIPGYTDQLAGSVALLPSGIALAWNTAENVNMPSVSRTAAARISDAGVVEWTRILEPGPAGWRMEPRGMAAAANGELRLLAASAPNSGSPPSIETAALATLTPDGQVRGMRTFASATEHNVVTGLRAARIWRSLGADALVTFFQSTGPWTSATAIVPMDEFASGAPSVSMTATPIPSVMRQVRVVVNAAVPVVPVGTTGTLTVAMPPGLIAGPATCTTLGAVACGTVYGGTTVVLPLTFDAAGSVQLSFDAAMPAGPTLTGPIVAMIDIDHPFATTHIRDRVASATVNLVALPDPLFGNGFE